MGEDARCGRCGMLMFDNEVVRKARGISGPCHDLEVCVLRLKTELYRKETYLKNVTEAYDNAKWRLSKALDEIESLKTSRE